MRTPAAEVAVPAPDSKVAYEVPSGKDTEPTVGLATEAGSAEKDELVLLLLSACLHCLAPLLLHACSMAMHGA